MNWTDEGIILGARPHGETAVVAEVLTRTQGRHLGFVHGGRSRRLRPVLQPGNHVDVAWTARLAEQLGHFKVEPRRSYAAEVMSDPRALVALSSMMALARLLPERDPHPNLYEVTLFVLGFLDDESAWPALLVRWELQLLDELGFGLDFSRCAATGRTDNLSYVSPRTGRAVSRDAGEPYRGRLLALPPFLLPQSMRADIGPPSAADIADGLVLTGHFLLSRVLQPADTAMPEPRERLAAALRRG